MTQTKSHETFDRPDYVVMVSDRSFGLVFACFFPVLVNISFNVRGDAGRLLARGRVSLLHGK
jgi:hypothetical protein